MPLPPPTHHAVTLRHNNGPMLLLVRVHRAGRAASSGPPDTAHEAEPPDYEILAAFGVDGAELDVDQGGDDYYAAVDAAVQEALDEAELNDRARSFQQRWEPVLMNPEPMPLLPLAPGDTGRWGILHVHGHQQIAGLIREVEELGSKWALIEVPAKPLPGMLFNEHPRPIYRPACSVPGYQRQLAPGSYFEVQWMSEEGVRRIVAAQATWSEPSDWKPTELVLPEGRAGFEVLLDLTDPFADGPEYQWAVLDEPMTSAVVGHTIDRDPFAEAVPVKVRHPLTSVRAVMDDQGVIVWGEDASLPGARQL